KLYDKLLVSKNSLTIAEFLTSNSELRHVVRRAFIVEKFPYSEIQSNQTGLHYKILIWSKLSTLSTRAQYRYSRVSSKAN
ncbi:MAG: hypothetical protein CME10_00440, partial [Gemmatimonadetes bacterium]|nr:hypothetical protein [Gemmatimonadota bacterium]